MIASDAFSVFLIVAGAIALVVGVVAWLGYFLWVVLAGAQNTLRRRY